MRRHIITSARRAAPRSTITGARRPDQRSTITGARRPDQRSTITGAHRPARRFIITGAHRPARRYIITGAPGAGKTTILAALRARGYTVVDEAATEINVRRQAAGCAEPWREPGFVDAIALLQRERLDEAPAAAVQVFDRSPICTLALARYLDVPVTPILAREIERVTTEGTYQPQVFFVRLLGFVTPTAVRRISLAESVVFERFHEQAYREHGFELVDMPAGTVEERVELIDGHIRSWG